MSTGNQEWETPDNFWQVIHSEFEPDLDVCATPNNAKCPYFIAPPGLTDALHNIPGCIALNGLETDWSQSLPQILTPPTFFCNPGFADVGPWIEKAAREAAGGAEGVVLTLASHAEWAQLGWQYAAECRLLYPRVQYKAPPGIKQSSNNRDGYLWVFRRRRPKSGCHIWPWGWKGEEK